VSYVSDLKCEIQQNPNTGTIEYVVSWWENQDEYREHVITGVYTEDDAIKRALAI
jgi:hypothetical protein